MKNVKNLLAVNTQGDTFTIELGEINSDSIMTVFLNPTDSDLESEFVTFDLVNENLIQAITDWDYKVVTTDDYMMAKMMFNL